MSKDGSRPRVTACHILDVPDSIHVSPTGHPRPHHHVEGPHHWVSGTSSLTWSVPLFLDHSLSEETILSLLEYKGE